MQSLVEQVESGTLTLLWRTSGRKVVCDDCAPRHNTGSLTLDQWEVRGLPGSGWSRCGGNCECQLLPEGLLGTDEPRDMDPIDIERILKEEGLGPLDRETKLRTAANRRLIEAEGFHVGQEVRYIGSRFPGFNGLFALVEELDALEGMVIRFLQPQFTLPEFQSLRIFEFGEVTRSGE